MPCQLKSVQQLLLFSESFLQAFLLHGEKLYQFTCTKPKAPDKKMLMGHCRSVGSQNWTCIVSPGTYNLVASLEFWKICGPLYMHFRISMYLVQSCYWFVKMLWIEYLFIFSVFNLLVPFHSTREACDISRHMHASLHLRPS